MLEMAAMTPPTQEYHHHHPRDLGDDVGWNVRLARYQAFFEFSPDCQLATNFQGVIKEANHAAAVLLRCRKEFLIEKPLGLLLMQGHRARFYEALGRLATDSGSEVFESRLGDRGRQRDVVMCASVTGSSHEYESSIRWVIHDNTERRKSESARMDLMRQLVTAQEDERRRLARELHDELGQHLTALLVDLKLLADTFPADSPAWAQLEKVRREAGQLGQAMHRIAVDLRPAALDDLGLDVTLRNHVGAWSRRMGIRADYCPVGLDKKAFPAEVATTIYRAVQEALTNVAKHADAARVSVILERSGDELRLIVEDDGRGFDPARVGESTGGERRAGLSGMRERVALVRGTMAIESAPGGPTTLFIRVPTQVPEAGGRSSHGEGPSLPGR
jgi:signal transduction histidine kinase